MNCRKCGSDTFVVDTREARSGEVRRRQCKNCKERFTTHECYVGDLKEQKETIRQHKNLLKLLRKGLDENNLEVPSVSER